METQLTTTEPSVALMLQSALASGVTPENAAAVEKMLGLYERMEAKRAEMLFNEAMSAFQREAPEIVATSVIPNRGKYERFENIMHVIKPLLAKNGLSVTFAQSLEGERIVQTCRVKHIAGHSEDTRFAVRLGTKADSETQADCKASTTAKRYALCSALNIIIHQDEIFNEDARIEGTGETITDDEARELYRRVKACGSDPAKFLAFADAPTFEEIKAVRLQSLLDMIARKEREKAAKPETKDKDGNFVF